MAASKATMANWIRIQINARKNDKNKEFEVTFEANRHGPVTEQLLTEVCEELETAESIKAFEVYSDGRAGFVALIILP